MNMRLRGQVVIAFRSNLSCFWEIWSVVSSTPRSGRWFFFSVQINYYKLFSYAYIFYNDKKQSKVLSNLSKITFNFWTVWYYSLWMKKGCSENILVCWLSSNLIIYCIIFKNQRKNKYFTWYVDLWCILRCLKGQE